MHLARRNGKPISIHDPMGAFMDYAERHRTLDQYDLADQDPAKITLEDVKATRIIASRISNAQAAEIIERASRHQELLTKIPPEADLANAHPTKSALYQDMTDLFDAIQGGGVRWSKASKVLHFKRPALFPILDTNLQRLYREAAERAATTYSDRNVRRMYWAAIRCDLIDNQDELTNLRKDATFKTLHGGRFGELSNLRLLDILAWSVSG